jgi:hypothetical protein
MPWLYYTTGQEKMQWFSGISFEKKEYQKGGG